MPAASTTVQAFALVIQPTGKFRLLPWTSISTPQHALRCDVASPIDLTTHLTAWHDPYAALLGQRTNAPASSLLALYVNRPPHHGDVVLTGATDADGHALGLDLDQALVTLSRFLDRPRNIPHPRRRCH